MRCTRRKTDGGSNNNVGTHILYTQYESTTPSTRRDSVGTKHRLDAIIYNYDVSQSRDRVWLFAVYVRTVIYYTCRSTAMINFVLKPNRPLSLSFRTRDGRTNLFHIIIYNTQPMRTYVHYKYTVIPYHRRRYNYLPIRWLLCGGGA